MTYSVTYKSETIPYTVRRSPRARRSQIVVRADKVEVVLPQRTRISTVFAQRWVEQNSAWIWRKLKKLKRSAKQLAPAQPRLGEIRSGVTIPYQGRTLCLAVDSRLYALAALAGDYLHLSLPTGTPEPERQARLKQLLLDWLKQRAHEQVQASATHYAVPLSVKPKSIRIKEQKSSWGSCGITGKLYINWRLILAPPDVLQYVVVHELCHLRYRNHSKRFWVLVKSVFPQALEARRWLTQRGNELALFDNKENSAD